MPSWFKAHYDPNRKELFPEAYARAVRQREALKAGLIQRVTVTLDRETIAAVNAGNAKPPQFVAATATILSPEEHMRKLTGQEFAVVDESRNGAPRHPRGLLHLPLEVGQGGAEDQLAALVAAIIEADSEAQVIAFHDSRQGIERVAKLIGRDDVLPYRSGYSPGDPSAKQEPLRPHPIADTPAQG